MTLNKNFTAMKKPWMVCILCGAAAGLCFWFPAAAPLAWIAPAPALYFIGKRRRGAAAAYTCGYFGVVYAMAYTINTGIDSVPLVLTNFCVHLAATALHGTLFAGALWLAAIVPCGRALRPIAFAVCWAGAEWLTELGPFAWPMAHLGVSQWQYPLLMQTAALGGPLFTGAVMMLFSGLLAAAASSDRRSRLAFSSAALAVAVAVLLCGAAAPEAKADGPQIALVQTGDTGLTDDMRLLNALNLARDKADGADLVLLPEGAGGMWFSQTPKKRSACAQTARTLKAPLMVGAWYHQEDLLRPAAYLFDAEGNQAGMVTKQRLVPLFENGGMVPFEWSAPASERILTDGKIETSVLICFESLFSSLVRKAARDAPLLTVLTSNTSFQGKAPRRLHFGHGALSAVATGRWLTQASVDGTTGAVSPAGKTTLLEGDASGVLRVQTGKAYDTPYLRWGETWLAAAAAALLLYILSAGIIKTLPIDFTGGKKDESQK